MSYSRFSLGLTFNYNSSRLSAERGRAGSPRPVQRRVAPAPPKALPAADPRAQAARRDDDRDHWKGRPAQGCVRVWIDGLIDGLID